MNKSTLGLRLTFIMTTLVLGCFVILLVMNTTALMDIVPSHYIAPNENYDKFCENIKQNDDKPLLVDDITDKNYETSSFFLKKKPLDITTASSILLQSFSSW